MVVAGAMALFHAARRRGRKGDPVPRGDPPKEPAGLLVGAAAFLAYLLLLAAVVPFLPAPPGAGNPAQDGRRPDIPALAIQSAVGVVVAAAALRALRAARRGPAPRAAPPGRAAGAGVLYAVAFLPVLAAATALQLVMKDLSGEPVRPQAIVLLASEGSVPEFLAVGAFSVLAAPFFEEVMFRGLLYGGLRAWTGPWFATLATAAAFAAIHWEEGSADALPAIFLLALFLCDLRERTGGLTAPVAMHACFNGLQMAAIYITRAGGGVPPGGG